VNARLGPALAGLATFLLHAAGWDRYGVFRDELYFLACGERLAFGYVDQPPAIAVVARLAHALFDLWVPGLRLLPWLASAAAVWLTGRLALRLGAGPWGATIAALAAAASPLLLGLGHLLTMNAFEPLLWTALALVVVRLAASGPLRDRADPRLWLAAGALAGVGVLNKYAMAYFAAALAVGLLATPARRLLASRWFVAGAALALLLVLPNFLWQAAHGFPFLELVANGQRFKNAEFSLAGFLGRLVLDPGPLAAPLWIAGLAFLLVAPAARPHRFLGIGALVLLLFLVATRAKPYYVGPLFPILFAAGGAAAEPLLARRWARVAIPAAIVITGAVGWPFAVPLLSKEAFVAYADRLGLRPAALERHEMGALPQTYADMFGWPELARAVADAARTLSEDERARAIVFAQNYGEASAIALYGRGLDLPPVTSGHNQWFLWGAPEGRGDVVLVVGDADEDCGGGAWRRRDVAVRLPPNPWVMPYESARWIWICREPTRSLAEIWPAVRKYI
jgi:hypothetical protein